MVPEHGRRKPPVRSPVPPPSRVIDGTSYDRAAAKRELRRELEECLKGEGQDMRTIRITAGRVTMTAGLNDSATAGLLWDALPFDSRAQTWGDEVYFDCPVDTVEEDPQASVPSGTVAYWPPGPALCLFFGQTPASPVNVVGRLLGDEKMFSAVVPGEPVRVERET